LDWDIHIGSNGWRHVRYSRSALLDITNKSDVCLPLLALDNSVIVDYSTFVQPSKTSVLFRLPRARGTFSIKIKSEKVDFMVCACR